MGRIHLVTFDVTNTIIRVLGGVGQNYAKTASIYGRQVEPAKIDASFKNVFKRYNELFPNFGTNSNLTTFKWWTGVVVDSFTEAGYPEGEDLTQIAHHLYAHFSTAGAWEVLPGAKKALTEIRESNVKVGVVSNFDERLENVLHSLGIRHYFDFVLASSLVGSAKPDLAIFKSALDAAAVHPFEAIHVGDNLQTDYKGAQGAGIQGVLYVKEGKQVPDEVDPNYVIHDLKETMNYLK